MGRRSVYPELSGPEARRAIEEDRAFDRAYERAEITKLVRAFSSAFKTGTAERAARAERRRVEQILVRERAERGREMVRAAAELEVREGVFVNLSDTVVEPTPEWLARNEGAIGTFHPKQPDQTVRTITSVRRVLTPAVKRMHTSGKITDDQLRACLWYRRMHEMAGLEGRYSAAKLDNEAGPTIYGSGGAGGHIPLTLVEAEARRAFRSAKAAIPRAYQAFFDRVVIDDVPIYRSYRLARCSRPAAEKRFRRLVQALTEHCEQEGIDLHLIDRSPA